MPRSKTKPFFAPKKPAKKKNLLAHARFCRIGQFLPKFFCTGFRRSSGLYGGLECGLSFLLFVGLSPRNGVKVKVIELITWL